MGWTCIIKSLRTYDFLCGTNGNFLQKRLFEVVLGIITIYGQTEPLTEIISSEKIPTSNYSYTLHKSLYSSILLFA